MRIIPLAFDSMGTRSMATYVETKGVKLVIDPAVSLAPNRHGLMPHKKETERMEQQWVAIKKRAKAFQVLIITHYHFDHYNPDEPDIYRGKIVLVKNPDEMTNKSQMERAEEFLPKLRKIAKQVEYADGREFAFGKTRICFSKPVFHGVDGKLGHVLEVLVEEGKERFLHTSDVEGPPHESQVEFILEHKPQVVFLDGPMTYMVYKFGQRAMDNSFQHMRRIICEGEVKKLVIDHHFIRDPEYEEKLFPIMEYGEEHGCKVMTASEFVGKKPEPLESMRRELYAKKA